jgi:hypothetical protein
MSWLDDYLEEMERAKRNQVKPMTTGPTPQPGSGLGGTIGKIANIAGKVANFIPGGQVVGVPLMVAGGALEGADKGGGFGGALMGAAKSGGADLVGQGLGSLVEGLKTPVNAAAGVGPYGEVAESFFDTPKKAAGFS